MNEHTTEHRPEPSITVLLAADDAELRDRIVELVDADLPGAAVHRIIDHVDFFRALQAGDFSLVITEDELHWSTGLEVTSAVKSLRLDVPVIMLGAVRDETAARAALDAGVSAYVSRLDDFETVFVPAVRSALRLVEIEDRVSTVKGRLDEILEDLQVGVFRCSGDGALVECNAVFSAWLGLPSAQDAPGFEIYSAVADPKAFEEVLSRLEQGKVRDAPVELARREGQSHSLWLAVSGTRTGEGDEAVTEGVAVDVTLQRQAQESLHRAAEQYRAVFETVSAATVIIDEDGIVTMANSAFEELSGYPREEIEGTLAWSEFVALDDLDLVRDIHDQRRREADATPPTFEFTFVNRNGKRHQVASTEALLPGTRRMVASLINMSARRKSEEQLLHNAFHDVLTSLPNRFQLLSRVDDILAESDTDTPLALFLLDLDRFRLVNDGLGHSFGNLLLQRVAERLRREFGEADTIARFADDTFSVVLHPVAETEQVHDTAARLVACFAEPFEIGGRELFTTATIGVAVATPESTSEGLLRDADAATSRAKALGRNRYVLFEEGMHHNAAHQFQVVNELRGAIHSDQLRLQFQPIFALPARSAVGIDALIHWQHPRRGLLAPEEFLGEAEVGGHIIPMMRWALREGCQRLHALQESHPALASLFISFRLSALHLGCPELADHVGAAVEESGLAATNVMLALPEQALMSAEEHLATALTRLAELKVLLCIDDFGKASASLPALEAFQFTAARLDRALMPPTDDDGPRWDLLLAVQSHARHLGLRAVVGGLDDPARLERFLAAGGEFGQGEALCPPVDSEPLAVMLQAMS